MEVRQRGPLGRVTNHPVMEICGNLRCGYATPGNSRPQGFIKGSYLVHNFLINRPENSWGIFVALVLGSLRFQYGEIRL